MGLGVAGAARRPGRGGRARRRGAPLAAAALLPAAAALRGSRGLLQPGDARADRARAARSPFENDAHVANALELRFSSRIDDRRRAIGGRSAIEAAIARAVPVDAPGRRRRRARGPRRRGRAPGASRGPRCAAARGDRRPHARPAARARQPGAVDMEPASSARATAGRSRNTGRSRSGRAASCACWSTSTSAASAAAGSSRTCSRSARASPATRRAVRVRAHLANCPSCARTLGELERSARSVAALLPLPAAAAVAGGLAARLGGAWSALRRLLGAARHPLAEAGALGRRRRRRRVAGERGRAEGRHRRGLRRRRRRRLCGLLAPRRRVAARLLAGDLGAPRERSWGTSSRSAPHGDARCEPVGRRRVRGDDGVGDRRCGVGDDPSRPVRVTSSPHAPDTGDGGCATSRLSSRSAASSARLRRGWPMRQAAAPQRARAPRGAPGARRALRWRRTLRSRRSRLPRPRGRRRRPPPR